MENIHSALWEEIHAGNNALFEKDMMKDFVNGKEGFYEGYNWF